MLGPGGCKHFRVSLQPIPKPGGLERVESASVEVVDVVLHQTTVCGFTRRPRN